MQINKFLFIIHKIIKKNVYPTCAILHMLKQLKVFKFILTKINYLLKSYTFNTKFTTSNAKLLFKTS